MSQSSSIRAAAGIAFLVCCLVAGCGDQKTARVSGTVTFKGQPLPAGKIYFMPDTAKGNTGQPGYADIKNGRYDTAAPGGQAAVSGHMIVAISGVDPSAKPEKASGDVTAKSLFERYETATELSGADSTKDFDVPADAGKGPAKNTGP